MVDVAMVRCDRVQWMAAPKPTQRIKGMMKVQHLKLGQVRGGHWSALQTPTCSHPAGV
jgi:hypothetical protein